VEAAQQPELRLRIIFAGNMKKDMPPYLAGLPPDLNMQQ
jgi:hypothetical protein